jgi:two-component system sensor histidine kinase KdpD
VTDCGPGIAPDEREQIFQKFNRVSGSGRAGLGLTIARAFVEAHGQHIEVTDAPSEGARFTFTMPVASLAAELA